MTVPLITTKLYMPPIRQGSVPRPRLIERLNAGLWADEATSGAPSQPPSFARKLTLVSAPAGFGKTTLVVEWLRALGTRGRAPLQAAWLSLDGDDNDPARFFTYLIAALEMVQADIGAEARALLQSPQFPSPKSALTMLINNLAAVPACFVLVLDDYHAIEQPSIHEALTFLLEHLPLQMHLVLAGRVDPPLPLARLRTRGQLAELRAADLRFTPQEAAAFLNDAMGLGLSAEDIAALESRTEGWVSGLQLAALSMRSQAAERMSDFVAAFSGSHRHVIDYLADEVMAQQPAEVHDFLCQTAILDRLTAPLCNAVTGRQDSDAVLEQLERANLFLVPLDDKRRWYRYHRLFADFLRNHLHHDFPDQVHDLHCWAAEWYERNGYTAAAVGHALEAEEHEWAARLVEETALATLMRGEVATVLGWLSTLPDALVRDRPRLCIAYAAALTVAGQLSDIEAYLQEAERGIQHTVSAIEQADLASQISVIRAYSAAFQGDLDRAIELTRRASERLATDDVFFRGIVSWLQGITQYFSKGLAAARRTFAETFKLSQAAGSTLLTLLSLYATGFSHVLQGHLGQAQAVFEQGLQLAGTNGPSPDVGGLQQSALGASLMYQGLGEVLRERNDLEGAERSLATCIELAEQWGNAEPLADSYVSYARVKHAQGDVQGAHEVMRKAEQLGQEGLVASLTTRQVEANRVRLWIAEGDLEAAARWAASLERTHRAEGDVDGQVVLYVRRLEECALARLFIAQGQFERALDLVSPLLEVLETARWTGFVIETLALQALALQGRGQTVEALDALGHALSLAEAEGYARVFLDEGTSMARLLSAFSRQRSVSGGLRTYVRVLLSAFEQERLTSDLLSADVARMAYGVSGPRPAATPATDLKSEILIEPLTDRELEVLQLVAAGFSNREIAERLTIALGTAKRHVSNIYAKLDAHSRVQAVAKARALQLV